MLEYAEQTSDMKHETFEERMQPLFDFIDTEYSVLDSMIASSMYSSDIPSLTLHEKYVPKYSRLTRGGKSDKSDTIVQNANTSRSRRKQ